MPTRFARQSKNSDKNRLSFLFMLGEMTPIRLPIKGQRVYPSCEIIWVLYRHELISARQIKISVVFAYFIQMAFRYRCNLFQKKISWRRVPKTAWQMLTTFSIRIQEETIVYQGYSQLQAWKSFLRTVFVFIPAYPINLRQRLIIYTVLCSGHFYSETLLILPLNEVSFYDQATPSGLEMLPEDPTLKKSL